MVFTNSGKISQFFNTNEIKYTCRFDIQIDNDQEFHVARRIVGAKGCNMKRIIEVCSKGTSDPNGDYVKLKLRGRGTNQDN